MNKTYSETFVVKGTDCDRHSRMRMDALFIAMQEGGETHAVQLGLGYDAMMNRGLFFVLSRIHVQIDRLPRSGETIVHTTWPGQSNRFFCPRYHTFSLEDGTPLLRAGALWVMLDTVKRGIISPMKVDLGFPDTSDIPEPIALPVRQPAMKGAQETISRTPVFSEFDVNNHVNNTKYIAWLCDTLGSSTMNEYYIADLVASYEKEIREEAPLALSLSREEDSFSFLVASETGGKHFSAGGVLKKENWA